MMCTRNRASHSIEKKKNRNEMWTLLVTSALHKWCIAGKNSRALNDKISAMPLTYITYALIKTMLYTMTISTTPKQLTCHKINDFFGLLLLLSYTLPEWTEREGERKSAYRIQQLIACINGQSFWSLLTIQFDDQHMFNTMVPFRMKRFATTC